MNAKDCEKKNNKKLHSENNQAWTFKRIFKIVNTTRYFYSFIFVAFKYKCCSSALFFCLIIIYSNSIKFETKLFTSNTQLRYMLKYQFYIEEMWITLWLNIKIWWEMLHFLLSFMNRLYKRGSVIFTCFSLLLSRKGSFFTRIFKTSELQWFLQCWNNCKHKICNYALLFGQWLLKTVVNHS